MELIKEISETELKEAVDSFPKGKAPGMDGLSIEFYSIFWPQIRCLFLEMAKRQKRQILRGYYPTQCIRPLLM